MPCWRSSRSTTIASCRRSPAASPSALHKSLVAGRPHQRRARRRPASEPIRYGIGLNIGPVMYGNIGVPERLAFSAIGPTVIEVARIEKLTKSVGARVLATREVAAIEPQLWRSIGQHQPRGRRAAAGAFRVPRGSGAAGGVSSADARPPPPLRPSTLFGSGQARLLHPLPLRGPGVRARETAAVLRGARADLRRGGGDVRGAAAGR